METETVWPGHYVGAMSYIKQRRLTFWGVLENSEWPSMIKYWNQDWLVIIVWLDMNSFPLKWPFGNKVFLL